MMVFKTHKRIKRILSCVLCIAMLINLAISVYADEQYEINEKKVELMQTLDIVWGYEDALKTEVLLPKGDFAILLARSLNISLENYSGQVIYSDVPEDNKAFAAINILTDMKILSPKTKTTFGINDYISKGELVELLAKISGYVREDGPFSYTSPQVIRQLLSGAKFYKDNRVTSFNVVEVLYNFLHLPVVTNDAYNKNFTYTVSDDYNNLAKNFNIYKLRGKIKSNDITAVHEGEITDSEKVNINGVLYYVGNTIAAEMVGYEVEAYYKHEKSVEIDTLVHIDVLREEFILTFNAADIDSYNNRIYTYYKNDRSKMAEISIAATVIYNGVKTKYNNALMKPVIGDVTLIDYDGDKKYDLVKIWSYETMVVDKMNTAEKIITFKYNVPMLDMEDEKIEKLAMYKIDGSVAGVFDLLEWKVLSVAKSVDENGVVDGKLTTIWISNKTETGKIEAINTKNGIQNIRINGREYEMSPHFQKSQAEAIEVGTDVKLFFDKYNKVASMKSQSSKYLYAYVIADARYNKKFENCVRLKMFTEENGGSVKILSFNKSIEIDGIKCDAEGKTIGGTDIYGTLFPDNNPWDQKYRLIRYKVNKDDKIICIDTINPNVDGSEGINLGYEGLGHRRDDSDPTSAIKTEAFKNNTFAGKTNINRNTKVFLLPTDRNDERKYSLVNSSFFANNEYYSLTTYKMDKLSVFDDVVITSAYSSSEKIAEKSTNYVVGDSFSALNADEEIAEFVEFHASSKVTYEISKDCDFSNVEKGDVVKIGVNSGNVVTSVRVIYDCSADKVYDLSGTLQGKTGETMPDWLREYKTLVGNVYQVKDGFVRCTLLEPDPANYTDTNPPADLTSYPLTGAKFLLIEENGDRITIESANSNRIKDYIGYGNAMSKIVLMAYWGDVRSVYIYSYK